MTTQESALWKGCPSQWLNLGHYLIAGVIIIALGALAWFTTGEQVPRGIVAGGIVVVAAYALWQFLILRAQVIELTSERLRITRGLINQRVDEIELYRIKDSQLLRTWWMRLTGLASITLETSDRSQPHLILPALPDGRAMREILRQQVESLRDKKRVREMDFDESGGDDGTDIVA